MTLKSHRNTHIILYNDRNRKKNTRSLSKKMLCLGGRGTETAAANERTTRKLRENWRRRCTHAGSSHRCRSIRNCTGNITQRPSPAPIAHTRRLSWPQPQSLIKPASDHPLYYIALRCTQNGQRIIIIIVVLVHFQNLFWHWVSLWSL